MLWCVYLFYRSGEVNVLLSMWVFFKFLIYCVRQMGHVAYRRETKFCLKNLSEMTNWETQA
jgi:hypothetical protein